MIQAQKKDMFSLSPTSLKEAMDYAAIIAKSEMVPTIFRNKPGDILIAVQMGAEIGLKPMQALQNICSINGRPCVWGDAMLAIVSSHPEFADIEETLENGKATCRISRKGRTDVIRSFSLKDAETAGLLKKTGPWTTYPERMLQMRARGFACRDMFPDALKGISLAEEIKDIEGEIINDPVFENRKTISSIKEKIGITQKETISLAKILNKIADSSTLEELESVKEEAAQLNETEREEARNFYKLKKTQLVKPEIESTTMEE